MSAAVSLAPAPPSAPKATLAAALVEAQRSAQAVEKSSRNDHHRYKYASAEAIILEAREALSSAGLALISLGWEIRGSALVVRYRLYHALGESLDLTTETTIVPDKGRPADKAEATASTYSLGYVLRSLLLLPRVEEGHEVDQRDDRQQQPPARGAGVNQELVAAARSFEAQIDEILVNPDARDVDLLALGPKIKAALPENHPLRLELAAKFAQALKSMRGAQ